MASIDKIKQAVAILEYADRTNSWPAITTDPEVNFLVDLLVDNEWEELEQEEKAMYEKEAELEGESTK